MRMMRRTQAQVVSSYKSSSELSTNNLVNSLLPHGNGLIPYPCLYKSPNKHDDATIPKSRTPQ
jgi:hypothetical protein